MIKIGLLGLGTVGSGVYEIIASKKNYFQSLLHEELEIPKILVKNLNKQRNINVPNNVLTTNPLDILNDPSIDIVIEVIGGVTDAYSYISSALKNNKHVITANKAVVAKHMKNLISLSQKNNKAFLFEASVGGGIPIIKPLKQFSLINDIKEIKGILNGTTNFILTKMSEDNVSFHEAVSLAQKLGYAEADPTDDIEGYDVARKLAILSSIAFKNETKVENITCRGISSVNSQDIETFKEMGWIVKLLGKAVFTNGNLSASVEPVLVEKRSAFSVVNDAYNIISVTGNIGGELQFYGQGAGKNPTTNAVICDLIDIITGSYKADDFSNETSSEVPNISLALGNYCIRITPKAPKDNPLILNILEKENLIQSIIKNQQDLVLITRELSTNDIEGVIELIKKFTESCFYIKMEEQSTTA